MLIVARVFQGFGAAMMTPQTMAVITRIFPADRRGQAMALWGATAGVATLVGPILGGLLVDAFGWEWIFFINVPVGLVALRPGGRLVPVAADPLAHRSTGSGLRSAASAMFALVFGHPAGPQAPLERWVLAAIIGGLLAFAIFVLWQSGNRPGAAGPAQPVRRPQLLGLQLRASRPCRSPRPRWASRRCSTHSWSAATPPLRPRCCSCRWP